MSEEIWFFLSVQVWKIAIHSPSWIHKVIFWFQSIQIQSVEENCAYPYGFKCAIAKFRSSADNWHKNRVIEEKRWRNTVNATQCVYGLRSQRKNHFHPYDIQKRWHVCLKKSRANLCSFLVVCAHTVPVVFFVDFLELNIYFLRCAPCLLPTSII